MPPDPFAPLEAFRVRFVWPAKLIETRWQRSHEGQLFEHRWRRLDRLAGRVR